MQHALMQIPWLLVMADHKLAAFLFSRAPLVSVGRLVVSGVSNILNWIYNIRQSRIVLCLSGMCGKNSGLTVSDCVLFGILHGHPAE